MREFFDWLAMVAMNLMVVGIIFLGIFVELAIIRFGVKMILGEPEPAAKTGKKSVAKRTGVACDWTASDEAQRRFLEDSIRAHEESVRLHDMAAIEAWDAQTTACDQHEAATDMFNDFGCGGCDPWF